MAIRRMRAASSTTASGEGDTLSSGRPRSRNPVSEARPDKGQRDSVARDSNPHGDTKLSSAKGSRQEQRGDTLASGRVGSKRPVSERS